MSKFIRLVILPGIFFVAAGGARADTKAEYRGHRILIWAH